MSTDSTAAISRESAARQPPDALPTPIDAELPAPPSPLRAAITARWVHDEAQHVRELLAEARLDERQRHAAQAVAADLVDRVRARAPNQGAVEAFMRQYDLGSEEGVLLMCVAEALLRIPDALTTDKLIRDKLGDARWRRHVGESRSFLVNATTWGLVLTGHLVDFSDATRRDAHNAFERLAGRLGQPVIRLAVRQAMTIMGYQFVMGETIEKALARADKAANADYRYSYDMLGEAALTEADAQRYMQAYRDAIKAIGAHSDDDGADNAVADGGVDYTRSIFARPGISVKLSALHPRYQHAQRDRVMAELTPRVLELVQLARRHDIGVTLDAEEADRTELMLDVFVQAHGDASLEGWHGFGLVVQAYQKRAPQIIDFVVDLARRSGRRIPLRLVKGAYWDTEIKRAQVDCHPGYPVFTRKPNTDVSYLACARRMLAAVDVIYPMFATHNAHTIATVQQMATTLLTSPSNTGDGGEGAGRGGETSDDANARSQARLASRERGSQGHPYEFQKLHGMGDDLYAEVIPADRLDVPCRVYAPVGSHGDLLPYLVRRLLENGANSSFVNAITDPNVSIDELVRDPIDTVSAFDTFAHPQIALPVEMFRSYADSLKYCDRSNAMGVNLANDDQLRELAERIKAAVHEDWFAEPLVPGATLPGERLEVTNPADCRQVVGHWLPADEAVVEKALQNAVAAQPGWDATPAADRAAILDKAADMLEMRMPEFIAMCTRDAGKSIPDGVGEVREAVDFLRYYACQTREMFVVEPLPGPTGESNTLQFHGRGVFVCISPWNFPLAIFIGQVAAALSTGNAVIAKPAEQTNLVGHLATKLLHEAGVPEDVLQFVPGDGAVVGAALTGDARVAGVAFTGSNETANAINRALAARDGAIGVLIAETGGQNALIADSSALPEQLVQDAMASAFTSAGQRCSAARVLFVQEDIAERVVTMLAGAMAELKVGDPGQLSTDVGPVIDQDAIKVLEAHAARMDREATHIATATLDEASAHGTFFAPRAYALESLDQLEHEVFGPVLHVVRWKADQLDRVIDAINSTGYGLTLGIHSRIDATAEKIAAKIKVGNCYVNRNQIGAVVGVQPFGGQNLSGTGPKAGGPHYLPRFTTEKTITINTTASGGNASLLTLGE